MWLMRIIEDDILSAEDKIRHMAGIMRGTVATSWLKSFDANANRGRGSIVKTLDRAEAKRFDSFADVMDCWKTQSLVQPLRPDGKPNRPLTAYTIEPVDEAKLN